MSDQREISGVKSAARGQGHLLAIVATSLTLATLPVGVRAASPPDSGLEGRAATLEDAQLGDIRGKFVGAGGIAYFSVELRSFWTNADGVTVAGVLAMSLDLRDFDGDQRGAMPLILVGWSRDCETCAETSAFGGTAPNITTLGTVNGVVQTQEIRGSDNTVQNGLRINVMPANLVNGQMPSGLAPASGSSSHGLSNGGAVHFVITPSQLGLALENGSQSGVVGQSVNAGQISQNVFLNSSMNTVHNSIGLTIGVDSMRQAEIANFQHSMSVLQGMGY